MALSQEEIQIVRHGKNTGKSKTAIMRAVSKYRSDGGQRTAETQQSLPQIPSQGESFVEARGDIKEGFMGVGEDLNKRAKNITEAGEAWQRGEQGLLRTAGQNIGQFLGGAADIAGQAVMTGGKLLLSKKGEEKVAKTFTDFIGGLKVREDGIPDAIAGKTVPELVEMYTGWAEENPAKARDVSSAGAVVEFLMDRGILSTVSKLKTNLKTSLFEEGVKATSVDDLITKTDDALRASQPQVDTPDTPAKIREKAEAGQAEVSFKEKWVGISPDVKKRIEGKQDQLQEYFDIAHARNLDDTVDTPYAYGATKVNGTVKQMEKLLNDTGGDIGATRQKLGTIKAGIDQVQAIEKTFNDQLTKLNLEIKNGKVIQTPGTIERVGAASDIKVINDLYNNLLTAKQSPTLTNLIDLRSVFDSKIKFAKSAREASNSVDPLSRQVRRSIADQAALVVGKTEAGKLKQYSEFMDAYGDLRSFTERKAGGEYLLRLVLSGRGREASELIQTVKMHTGTDLMDDATMMTIATDLIGNSRQQNLFRQEITKAGLDVAQLASGRGTGAAGLLSDFVTKRFFDEEKIFLDAAKGTPTPKTPTTPPVETAPVSSTKSTTQKIADAILPGDTPGKEGGYVVNPFSKNKIKGIDAATKEELNNVVAFLKSGKTGSKWENLLNRLADKYGIPLDVSPAKQIAYINKLLDKTETMETLPGGRA